MSLWLISIALFFMGSLASTASVLPGGTPRISLEQRELEALEPELARYQMECAAYEKQLKPFVNRKIKAIEWPKLLTLLKSAPTSSGGEKKLLAYLLKKPERADWLLNLLAKTHSLCGVSERFSLLSQGMAEKNLEQRQEILALAQDFIKPDLHNYVSLLGVLISANLAQQLMEEKFLVLSDPAKQTLLTIAQEGEALRIDLRKRAQELSGKSQEMVWRGLLREFSQTHELSERLQNILRGK